MSQSATITARRSIQHVKAGDRISLDVTYFDTEAHDVREVASVEVALATVYIVFTDGTSTARFKSTLVGLAA